MAPTPYHAHHASPAHCLTPCFQARQASTRSELIKKVLSEEGIAGFFNGALSSIVATTLQSAFYYYFFAAFKSFHNLVLYELARWKRTPPTPRPTHMNHMRQWVEAPAGALASWRSWRERRPPRGVLSRCPSPGDRSKVDAVGNTIGLARCGVLGAWRLARLVTFVSVFCVLCVGARRAANTRPQAA